MNICEYGCGREAKYKLNNGKWCCSDHTNKCPINRKRISIGRKNIIQTKPILIETTELCDYGCGQIAKYKFKNGKICCSENSLKCLGTGKRLSEIRKPIRIKTTELCSYGCGQKAKFKLKNGNLCCNSHVNKCQVKRTKISILIKGMNIKKDKNK